MSEDFVWTQEQQDIEDAENLRLEPSYCLGCEKLYHHRHTTAHARYDFCSKECEDAWIKVESV